MYIFEKPGERVIIIMTSGNLAITQSLISILQENLTTEDAALSLWHATNFFEVARLVGKVLREVHQHDAEALRHFAIDFNAALIVGGQISGERPRLFSLYAAGNFIEATPETPYFQIGESKYGKPIIDRVLKTSTSLAEAAKCALISMDSTIRSNLSVGLPLDLAMIRTDELRIAVQQTLKANNPYLQMIHIRWGEALRQAFNALPNPPCEGIDH
jgi:putative proteasome-type protease